LKIPVEGDQVNEYDFISILLVEDSLDDINLIKVAFDECNFLNKMYVARDGAEALDFLYKRGNHVNAIRPDIVLLDLNLPKKSGREVLEQIKSDDDLKDIPVIILTTSKSEEDILNSYQLHANCYITKPVDFTRFIEIIKQLENFWFSIATLPKR
jgi:CheY-like chemotaxis protein